MSFGYFKVRFSGIGRETCQEAHCAIKWKFFFDLCLGSSDSLINMETIVKNFMQNFAKCLGGEKFTKEWINFRLLLSFIHFCYFLFILVDIVSVLVWQIRRGTV